MASYGTDQGLIDYLDASGRQLPSGVLPAYARSNGTIYVDQFEPKFRSTAISDENSFPRIAWPAVPVRVEYAAYEAGWAYATGIDIFGTGGAASNMVTEERVDVLSVKYAGPQDGMTYWESMQFILPRAYALLVPYLRRNDTTASAFVV